jgi:phage shock protein A
MPLFPRTRDIHPARVDEIVARASDREQMMRLIIKDIEEALIDTRARESRLLQQRRNFGLDVAIAEIRQAELTEQARHALVDGREDLARGALNRKYDLAGEAAGLRQRMDILKAKADAIAVEVARLEGVLAEVRSRRDLPAAEY